MLVIINVNAESEKIAKWSLFEIIQEKNAGEIKATENGSVFIFPLNNFFFFGEQFEQGSFFPFKRPCFLLEIKMYFFSWKNNTETLIYPIWKNRYPKSYKSSEKDGK